MFDSKDHPEIEFDRYILARFCIRFGCMVEEQDTSFARLLGKIPDHLHESDDSSLSVCEVKGWRGPDNGNELEPYGVRTLYQVTHYEDPIYEEEAEERQEIAEARTEIDAAARDEHRKLDAREASLEAD